MKAFVVCLLAALVGCGGRELVADCTPDDAGVQQLCSPSNGAQFCCPADSVCGTTSNGCPAGTCCPSPVTQ